MAETRGKTILLVEDEAIVALAESTTLRGFGYEVVLADSGEAAVKLASEADGIDLVLMDVDLGGGFDGLEAARLILGTRRVPIVFLTSRADRPCVDRAKAISGYGYVVKGASDFALRTSIETAFEIFGANEALRRERDELLSGMSALRASEERMRSLLEEKDALLKEQSHRVKNGMSNLMGILALQAEAADDPGIGDALRRARTRIQCMGPLFDRIDIRERRSFVLAREYFDEMLPDVFDALRPHCEISLRSDIDDVLLPAEYFFPIGILAHELITNAVKHAFPARSSGRIEVGFHASSDSECVLRVADDGVGMETRGAGGRREGFGTLLVDALSRQLRGRVEFRRGAGTECSIYIPVEKCLRSSGTSAGQPPAGGLGRLPPRER